MRKYLTIVIILSILSLITLRIISETINSKSLLTKLSDKDPEYIEYVIGIQDFSTILKKSFIYRSRTAIILAYAERDPFWGWQITEVDRLTFEEGPNYKYIDSDIDENTSISMIYGYYYENKENPRGLVLINEDEKFEQLVSSRSLTDIRVWFYDFHSLEPNSPNSYILKDIDSKEKIYMK